VEKEHIINDAMREKGSQTKAKNKELKNQHGIPTMSKAIRDNCVECVGGSVYEVKSCVVYHCPLFPFRFGRNPKPKDLKVPVFDKAGDLVGEREYPGYMVKNEDE